MTPEELSTLKTDIAAFVWEHKGSPMTFNSAEALVMKIYDLFVEARK